MKYNIINSFNARSLRLYCACAVLFLAGGAIAGPPNAAPPNALALSSKQKKEIHQFLNESVERKEIPGGALLLLQDGQILYKDGFGYADLNNKKSFQATTPIRIASLSKPLIATLIVALVAEGKIDLDESIASYLPEFNSLKLPKGGAASRPPTVKECLKHTAGFLADAEPGGRPWLKLTGKGMTLEQVVKQEATYKLAQNPGEKFAYSGIGYDVVGRIAEVTTGQSLNDLLQDKICKVLGMHNTTFNPDDRTMKAMPKFYWHWRSDGSFHPQVKKTPIPEGGYRAVGGGIVSTLGDYSKFLLLHLNQGSHNGQQIIPANLMREMRRRYSPGSYYGLGLSLGPSSHADFADSILHTGSSGTQFWLDFRTGIVGILFTQSRMSKGRVPEETQQTIPKNQASWQKQAKHKIIEILASSYVNER